MSQPAAKLGMELTVITLERSERRACAVASSSRSRMSESEAA